MERRSATKPILLAKNFLPHHVVVLQACFLGQRKSSLGHVGAAWLRNAVHCVAFASYIMRNVVCVSILVKSETLLILIQ